MLSSWVIPRPFFNREPHAAHQDEFPSPPIAIPMDTPPGATAPYVEMAVKGLFNLFGGAQISSSVIEQIVTRTIDQRF